MDIQQIIDRVMRIIKLQPDVYTEVAEDETATLPAFLVAGVATLLGGIGTTFTNADFGLGSAIGGAVIFAPLGLLLVTGVFHLIAKIFGGTGSYMPLLRPLGHGYAPAALGIIPFIGLLGSFWVLACAVIAVREVEGLSTGKAVAVVLIPAAILFLLAFFAILALVAVLTTAS